MDNDTRRGWRDQCDREGISWARGALPNRVGEAQEYIREWIDEFERREAAEESAEQRRLAKEAIDAARDSANTSREAAEASRVSARWTMWAAIAAAISAAVPFLQAIGVLPK